MIFKHNTAIINDIIIEQNIKNFDPRWISRGAFHSEKKIWIMNIPKNASNSIGRLIAPGNRARSGWLTEQRYSESGQPDHNFFVVLRNPLERFYGSLAQHYIIQMERDATLTDINHKIDNLEFMSDIFDDIHIWPQFSYLHGLPVKKTTFLDLKNIEKLPNMVGISDDIQSWNVSDDNPDQKATKQRIRAICETNPDVMSVLQEYYATDLEIMEENLGYVPKN
jgi:hypothetical protein